jgi:hypothetical protein
LKALISTESVVGAKILVSLCVVVKTYRKIITGIIISRIPPYGDEGLVPVRRNPTINNGVPYCYDISVYFN